jgi:hypothetical protein
MRTIVLAIACLMMAAGCANTSSAKAAYSVWTETSLEKVFKRSPLKPLEPATISAARGEHEAFQIVLRAGREGLTGVKVTTSDLKSGADKLPASVVSAYVEHYVHLPSLNEDYPDALPPYQKPFDLAAGATQPLWIDVSVPRSAKPGLYSGTVTIAPQNTESVAVPFTLKVYNFEMPAGPKMTTAFGLWSLNYLEFGHGLPKDAPEAEALHRKYYDFLLDHGVSSFHAVPGGIYSDEFARYVTDPRVTSFTIEFTKDEQEMRRRLDRVRSLGVWDKAYFYFVDEPKSQEHYDQLKEGAEYLRKIDPKVNIVSPYYCAPEFAKDKTVYDLLVGTMNIWCPVTGYFDEKRIAERRAAGDKIWDYVCCGPRRPYANFFVDWAPLEHRMLFWQNYLYQVTGLLYWDTICWNPKDIADPWEDMATVKWIGKDIYGDGSLLYPGKKVGIDGPVSSIRLECIRDGIEDYDYLWLLEQKAGRDAVLPYVRKLTTDWKDFTRSPKLFRSVREEIAAQLEQPAKG